MSKHDEIQDLRRQVAAIHEIIDRRPNRGDPGAVRRIARVRDLGHKPTAGDRFVAAEVMRLGGEIVEGGEATLIPTDEIMMLVPLRWPEAPSVDEDVIARRVDNRWIGAPRPKGCQQAGVFWNCICECRYPFPRFATATDGNGDHLMASNFQSALWQMTYPIAYQTWRFDYLGGICDDNPDLVYGVCSPQEILELPIFLNLLPDCLTNEWRFVVSFRVGLCAEPLPEGAPPDPYSPKCRLVSPPSQGFSFDPAGGVEDRIPLTCDWREILEFEIPTGVDGMWPTNGPGPYPTPGGGGPITVVFQDTP